MTSGRSPQVTEFKSGQGSWLCNSDLQDTEDQWGGSPCDGGGPPVKAPASVTLPRSEAKKSVRKEWEHWKITRTQGDSLGLTGIE